MAVRGVEAFVVEGYEHALDLILQFSQMGFSAPHRCG